MHSQLHKDLPPKAKARVGMHVNFMETPAKACPLTLSVSSSQSLFQPPQLYMADQLSCRWPLALHMESEAPTAGTCAHACNIIGERVNACPHGFVPWALASPGCWLALPPRLPCHTGWGQAEGPRPLAARAVRSHRLTRRRCRSRPQSPPPSGTCRARRP